MNDKIIDSSVKLFNKNGINKTSFRDIAADLEVSDGHVRYYFKTKERLLLAIFDQMDEQILVHAECIQNPDLNTHEDLKRNLANVFNVMIQYRFFFVEAPSTFNQYPELTIAYRNLIQDRKKLFLKIFKELIDQGFFTKEFTIEIQEMAFYNIFIISDSWIRYYSILNNKKPDKAAIEFHCNLLFSILLPYIK